MSDDAKLACFIFLPMILVALVGAGAVGYAIGGSHVRMEAVEYDAAHYIADPETGASQFMWHSTGGRP